MGDSEEIIVSAEEADLRLDKFLALRFPHFSREYFQELIEKNLVLINGSLVKKRTRIQEGDEIEIEFAATAIRTLEAQYIPLDILYEDEALLAINKPPGLVVHPAVGNWTGTFVNGLLYHCKQLPQGDSLRPGIVHRLDKDTSGVLLAAKTEYAQMHLVDSFAKRLVKKEYRAIAVGNPGKRVIEGNIGRHPTRRQEMTILEGKGKEARTLCEPLSCKDGLCYLRLIPETGRTHQLRVHLKSVGCPILGDSVYGNAACNKKWGVKRQLLHAYRLSFPHPVQQKMLDIEAPIPEDFNKFI